MWKTIGFQNEKNYFESAIKKGEFSHAYIFHGQDMIGKRTFAVEFAEKIASPMDIISIDSDIASVREAKRFLSLSPMYGGYKVAIIDNAEKLQEEAQHALLKILEEPSDHCIFLLVTSRSSALLRTITSRCRHMFFPTHDRTVIRSFLKDSHLSENQIDFLCDFSNGSIGLLASMENFGEIKSYVEEYTAISKAGMGGKFDMALKLSNDEKLSKKILYWMLYLRSKKHYSELKGLLSLYNLAIQPQYSRQLALENFMLQL